jgi:hypothetical protein
MIVMAVAMIIMSVRRVGIRAMRVVVMLDLVAARVARMRANDRDGSRNDSADQRQKNDCLDHVAG